jgi:hypothetical protein
MPNGYEDRLFVKLMTSLARYHQKHGSWPITLRASEALCHDLQVLFDEFSVGLIDSRLKLIVDEKSFFVAEGPEGQIYKLNLNRGGYAEMSEIREAAKWLTGRDIYSKGDGER